MVVHGGCLSLKQAWDGTIPEKRDQSLRIATRLLTLHVTNLPAPPQTQTGSREQKNVR